MKLKFWDRMILLLVALCALLSAVVFAHLGVTFAGENGLPGTWRVLCLIFSGLSLVGFGLLFLLFRRSAHKRLAFVVQHTDNGELRIAVSAIKNLIKKCIDVHEEIQTNQMRILHGREGITVDLDISLANNISIPLAVASLQKQIKQYLVASSGIDVKEVRVCVESTLAEADASLPLSIPMDAPVAPVLMEIAEEEPVREEKKKVPLHRRLFCRADQAAVVPEAPKDTDDAQDDNIPASIPAVPQDQPFAEDADSTAACTSAQETDPPAEEENAEAVAAEADKEENTLV